MSENLKFQLLFSDRIGIVFDIARLMSGQGLNIIAMEMEQENGFAKISVEIEIKDQKFQKKFITDLFATLPGFKKQSTLRRLPQEKRENWFRTLFDGMSEGIISVDANGIINTANSVACRILGQMYENIIGVHIREVNPKDSILVECLEKRVAIARRKLAVTNTGRIEFYGSAKPINDSSGNFAGAVLLMKNLKEVKELVDAVSVPIQVTFDDFLGESRTVENLINFAKKISDTGTTVSITGESGTGKELFARAIHFESGRTGPFIPINCAALPEQLIESELFGYVDGAFTGARVKGKPGLFEAACDGTIFLDEIGDMPPGPQAKILRVLQDGLVRRIGGFEEIPVNTRVITATNKNLREMVDRGIFREDLFYRINVLTIQIPPLKERLTDVPLLASEFLHQFTRKVCKADQTISQAAVARLISHSWPGNVRELKNVIERASVLSDSDLIRAEVILLSHGASIRMTDLTYSENRGVGGTSMKDRLGKYETEIILEALNEATSIRKAALALGLSHTALLRKIRKYHLSSAPAKNHWNINVPER